jgi:hypothetical protein
MTSREDIRNYIIEFNIRFPVDRWWRKKYNQSFNSFGHRESNFIDQLIEYEEEKLFDELVNAEKYEPNTGDWLKQKEIDPSNLQDQIADFREEFNLESDE